ADADLVAPARHHVRHHAVEADGRDQPRQPAEEPGERGHEPLRQQRALDLRGHGVEVQRDLGMALGRRARDRGLRRGQGAWAAARYAMGPTSSRMSRYFVSFTTPTTWYCGRGAPSGSSIWKLCRSGSLPARNFRAKDSLTIATTGEEASSRSSNSRPATSGVRSVLKYPGLTRLKFG